MLTPLWPGCPVGWELRGAGGKKPTVVARVLDPELDPAPSRGGPRGGGADRGGGAARPAVQRARRGDELSFVFNEGVHCYALRRAAAREPSWLEGVRRSALQRWRELAEPPRAASPLGCWAASRLVGGALLDGPNPTPTSTPTPTLTLPVRLPVPYPYPCPYPYA